METKVCNKCGVEKPLSEYYKDRGGKFGVKARCKCCEKAYDKAYYEANKDKKKAYREANKDKNKAYREANKDKLKAKNKAYREDNKDKLKAKNKAYREDNKDKLKSYREANKDKMRAYDKAYREANKDKIKAKNKAYYEDNKDELKTQKKAYYEDNKDERIANLCKTFGRTESEVDGTIYHFAIGDGFKIGKSVNGFENRYDSVDKDKAHSVVEWVMNVGDMDKLEKVVLHETRKFQYVGDNLLSETGNREVRSVDCEKMIDDFIERFSIDCEKIRLSD